MENTYSQPFIGQPSQDSRGDENEKIVVNDDNGDRSTNISLENQHEETSKKSCLQRFKETHTVVKILAILVAITIILGLVFVIIYSKEQKPSATPTLPPLFRPDPSEFHILVLRESLEKSYVISGDGKSRVTAEIEAPTWFFPDSYIHDASFALIGNQFFLFGAGNRHQIAVLEGCSFTEQSAKLVNPIGRASAALSILIGGNSGALICYPYYSNNTECEIFDGKTSKSTFSTNYGHYYGGLGFYKNQPITVGSASSELLEDNEKKVETLGDNGWTVIGVPPIRDIYAHALVGLDSGNLLLLGGEPERVDKDVWLLSEDFRTKRHFWSRIGSLLSGVAFHSALKIHDSIFLFAGFGVGVNPVQRIDMEGDEIKTSEIIGNHVETEHTPVLVRAEAGFCAKKSESSFWG